MRWLYVCLVWTLIFTAGCPGFSSTGENRSKLDFTVQNDRAESVSFQVVVTDGDGVTIANESERVDSGVGQTFEFTVGRAVATK